MTKEGARITYRDPEFRLMRYGYRPTPTGQALARSESYKVFEQSRALLHTHRTETVEEETYFTPSSLKPASRSLEEVVSAKAEELTTLPAATINSVDVEAQKDTTTCEDQELKATTQIITDMAARLINLTKALATDGSFGTLSNKLKDLTRLKSKLPHELKSEFESSITKLEEWLDAELPEHLATTQELLDAKREITVDDNSIALPDPISALECSASDFKTMQGCFSEIESTFATLKPPSMALPKPPELHQFSAKLATIAESIQLNEVTSNSESRWPLINGLIDQLQSSNNNYADHSKRSTQFVNTDQAADTELLEALRKYLRVTKCQRVPEVNAAENDLPSVDTSVSVQSSPELKQRTKFAINSTVSQMKGPTESDKSICCTVCGSKKDRLLLQEKNLISLARVVLHHSDSVDPNENQSKFDSTELFQLFFIAVKEYEEVVAQLRNREQRIKSAIAEIETASRQIETDTEMYENHMKAYGDMCTEYYLGLKKVHDRLSYKLDTFKEDLQNIIDAWGLIDKAKREIAMKEKNLLKQGQTYTVKNDQLQKRLQDLSGKEKALKQLQTRVTQKESQLNIQLKSVKEKEKHALEREADGTKKQKELDQKLTALNKKALEISNARDKFKSEEGNLSLREIELKDHEEEMKIKETSIQAQIITLEEKTKSLKLEEEQLQEQTLNLSIQYDRLKDKETLVEDTIKELEHKVAEFNEQQRLANAANGSETKHALQKCLQCVTMSNLLNVLQERDKNRRDQEIAIQQSLEAIRLRENSMQELSEALRFKERDLSKWQSNLDLHEKLLATDLAKTETLDSSRTILLLREALLNVSRKLGANVLLSALGPSIIAQLTELSASSSDEDNRTRK